MKLHKRSFTGIYRKGKINPVLFLLFLCTHVSAQFGEEIIIGKRYTFHSDILNEERGYLISLPDSYNNAEFSNRRYPLLVILDGNTHFHAITGMAGYMSKGRNPKIPEMIIVAIQSVDRRRDFTPDKVITVRENNTGGGDKFLDFLEKELIPDIDTKYRTDSYRILFGHSLGGLITTHAYLKEETLFNAFIAVDPSFGTWDEEIMDEKLESITSNTFERFLYIATANWGKRNLRNRDRHVRFYESLNSKSEGIFPGKLEYFENENHNSVALMAFYNGILAIFDVKEGGE